MNFKTTKNHRSQIILHQSMQVKRRICRSVRLKGLDGIFDPVKQLTAESVIVRAPEYAPKRMVYA